MTESKIQVGMSENYLETSKLTNGAGIVHREGVFLGSQNDVNVVAEYAAATPSSTATGIITRPIMAGQTLGSGDITQDAWGLQKVSHPHSLYHGLFTFDIPASMWFMYENGTQVYTSTDIVSTNSAGVLTTTVTNPDLVLESRECPRYQPNRGHHFATAVWCPSKTADGHREWGLRTDENGVYFKLKADGLLYACLKSNSIETHEELIDTSGVTGFDVEKGNVYDIQYQWRGVGSYKFFVNLVEVHTLSLLGTLTALSMENPALPISFHCHRTTEDVAMHIGCADITSEAGRVDIEQYGSAYAEGVSVSTDTPVIVVANPLQIGGETNTRTATLARISFFCSKKGVFKVWASRNPADITGEVLKAVGNGSYVQTDSTDMDATATRATAATIANMKFITAVPVAAAQTEFRNNPFRGRIEFPVVRGDYLIVTCTAATASADVVVEWGEQI